MDKNCRYRVGGFRVSLLFIVATALPGSSNAAVITIDSDAMTINGIGSGGTFNGTSFVAEKTGDGITRFSFSGDLTIDAGDTVVGVGGNGVSLFSFNNVNIGAGARFDLAAQGTNAGAGGGHGGEVSTNANGGRTGIAAPRAPASDHGDGGAGGAGGQVSSDGGGTV